MSGTGDSGTTAADAKRHLANWQDEIDSVALYTALADLEPDQRLADVYQRLAPRQPRLRRPTTACCRTSAS